MPVRKPSETLFQFAMRVCWETGQFWGLPDGVNITQEQVALLHPTDDIAVRALIALSKMDSTQYTIKSLDAGHSPDFNGDLNPGMAALLDVQRCPVPDHAPPPGTSFLFEDPAVQQVALRMQERQTMAAIGSGSWPNCHGIGNFHCATIRVNPAGIGSFLKPLFLTVLKNVQMAYAQVGLLFRFIGMDNKDMMTGEVFSGNINSDLSFVASSSGYIGIAIVGQNEDCSSKIWNRYLSTYRGGSTDAEIVTQWTSLVSHELGHNCGLGHSPGGKMNSSIVNGLPTEWTANDPSTPKLRQMFGGQPVQIPGGQPPGPGPGPNPPSFEERLHAMEIKTIVNEVTLAWVVNKVKNLP